MSKYEIYIGDIFYLTYYGVNVFFEITGTDWTKAVAFELKTKKINEGKSEMVCFHRAKNCDSCLVITQPDYNSVRGSKMFDIKEINNIPYLEIPVSKESELYKAALRAGIYKDITPGNFYAVKINDCDNYKNWYYDYHNSDIPQKEIRAKRKEDRVWSAM